MWVLSKVHGANSDRKLIDLYLSPEDTHTHSLTHSQTNKQTNERARAWGKSGTSLRARVPAGLEIRQTRPCTDFGAQKPTAHVFGRLPPVPRAAKGRNGPFARPRSQRRTSSTACRGLGNSPNAALHRFRGPEANGARFWTPAACAASRKRPQRTVCEAQKPTAHVFELAAGLEIRQTRPCTDFGAQKPTAHVFGRLPPVPRAAKGRNGPFARPRSQRRTSSTACRGLGNSPNAALHRFRGPEANGARFWTPAACAASRKRPQRTVCEAQKPTAHVFDRLPRAWKFAKRGPAPISGPRSQRRTFLDACRLCREPQKAATDRLRGPEANGARLRPLAAGLEIRQTRPCTDFGAQKPTAHVFGRLPPVPRAAKGRNGPFARPRSQRRTSSTACRGLGNSPNAALHRFRGPEANGARFWTPAACAASRKRPQRTVCEAQKPTAHVFDRLPRAWKFAKRGPAPISGPRSQRRTFLDACRLCREPQKAATDRLRGPEANGARLRPLAAGLEIRQTRPCTDFGAQKPTAHVFGRLPPVPRAAKGRNGPFARPRSQRRTSSTACRGLGNSPNAALHRFRGPEANGARFWTPAACAASRKRPQRTVCEAQKPTAHVFDRLPRAWKFAKRGPAPISGPRSQRRTFLDACRLCREPQKAATDRLRGPEANGARLRPLAAGLEIRQTRPCTDFGAQKPTAHVFGRLPPVPRAAKGRNGPFARPRSQRRTSSTACRGLGNSPNAALHRFRGPEANGARFWTPAACAASRKRPQRTVCEAQKPTAHVFDRLPRAWKFAKRGPAPISGPRSQRRTFLDACRLCREPQKAATDRLRGPEANGARLRPLAAGLEIRQTRPCTDFGAQKPTAHVFGRLPPVPRAAKGRNGPFARPRSQRRTSSTACRGLGNSPNAALHRFRGPEANGARFWTPAACAASRKRPQRTVCEAQKPTAHVFDRLPRAWKFAKRGPAPISGPRSQRRTFLDACRLCREPQKAATDRLRGPEANGARLRPLAAGLEIRQTRPCTDFGAQKPTAHVFGRLPPVPRAAKGRNGPFARPRSQRRTSSTACRGLGNSPNAALHRFRGPEANGARFWTPAACAASRKRPQRTVCEAQKPTAHVFDRLPRAWKFAKRGPAPISGPRSQRRTFLDACRLCREPQKAATDRLRGPEANGARLRPLAAGLEIRQTRPCTDFGAQKPTAHVFGRLPPVPRAAKGRNGPFARPRSQRRTSSTACRGLGNSPNAALHRFRGPEANGARFWTPAACAASRKRPQRTVCEAQKPTAHVFDRLPRAWKFAKRGPAPISGPRSQRRTFLDACRLCREPQKAATDRLRGPEANGARLRPLAAGLEIRQTRPCTDFGAQKPTAHVFGRLPPVPRAAKGRNGPFARPRSQRRTSSTACRGLGNSPNAALHRFRGPEANGARFWTPAACAASRKRPQRTVCEAQKPTAHVFDRLPRAWKFAKRGPAPISGPRSQRRTFLDACRLCREPQKAATDRLRGPEANGARLRPLAAGLEIRQTRPCTDFGAQKPTAHVFGRLPPVPRAAKGRNGPFARPRSQRRTSSTACRGLGNSPNAALHRFRGPEANGARFWTPAACAASRKRPQRTVCEAQKPTAHVFDRLPRAWKFAKRGPAPISGPRSQRRTFLDACRLCREPQKAATDRLRGPEANGARLRPLAAGLEIRQTRPCTDFGAQKPTAHVFGRLPPVPRAAKGRNGPFARPRSQRRTSSTACRGLGNSPNAALHRFRGPEANGARFWTPAACAASRKRPQRTVCEAQKPTAHVFDRLPRAWKFAKRGPAPISGPRSQRRTFLDACRLCREPQKAATDRLRGPEANGARLRPLAAGLEIRQTRPCTDFGAQKPTAHVFGRLPPVPRAAKGRNGPFARPRSQRRTSSTACRGLGNSPNAALHRFRGPEANGARFWTPAACAASRKRPQRTVCEAQKPTAHVFDRLPRAWKFAKRGPAPISGPRSQRRTFLDACRLCREPQKAATDRLRGPEANGARLRPLAAGLEIRQTRPCTDFGAQKPTAHVFGRLPPVPRAAKGRNGPFARPRSQRRTSSTACRGLGNSPNAALHRFRGPEANGARFWTPAACAASRKRPQRTVCEAQKPTAHVFDRLPRAWKFAKRGPAPISGPRSQRRTFLDACRLCREPQKAATDRLRGPEANGARLRPLAAGLEIRQTRPCTDFGAQKPTAHVFGRLPPVPRAAKGRNGPFARPRSQRRTSSTACRGLGNSPNAALHRFRGPEANGARFWTPAACAASRKRPQRTVCEAQKPTAHVFDRLPRAWKFAKRGPAPISGPRSQRRTFLDACRLCREPQKAATDRLRGPEANGARLRPLAAGLEIRQTRPCTDFGAQKPTAHVFGRLPPVPRAAKGRNGPFARPRSQRRTSSTACRGLGNSPNAALHRFRGPEANGARFWTPAACAASRKRPQRTVCEAQKPTAHVFDRLPRAWKFAKRGPAPISGPRSQRRTFLDACRLCREPQKAATDRLRGPEANGARLRPLAAGLEIRQTRPCTDFGAQKPTAHVFGRLPPVPRAAKGRNGPFARPRSQRRTSSTACRGLGNSPNAALHRFRGPEANGARFWTPAACAASRKRPQRTVCEAQKPTAHVFDRLPRAWKFAKRGPAPISGPRSQRRTFLDACRLCREPQKAATDRLRGPEANGARLRPLAAGLEIRQTRPCTDFGAQKPTAHVFGRLPPVPRAAKGRNGPFARPRSQRRTSSTACRGLGNSPNAALHRFRGPEANGARFWTPAACAASRKRPQRTVCEAQKPTAHVFDRLPRAWKFAKRGPAPISGPRSQRRTFLDACRLCREPQKAATDRLRGPEANGARLRPLAAGLEIRQTRPCTDFGAQKPTAHVFGRLPPVPRAAKGRNGPFARPRSQRRTSSTACRGLGNSPNAALHRFRGPEANGARFWTPAACAASRKRPQRTVCEAQKPTAHVFDRLPRAWKFAKRGPAPISGPRSQRRTFLDACRLCREPQKAATDRLRGPEANGARLRPLAAGLEIRQTRPCTDFGAQKPTAHVFGRLPPVPRAAKGRNGPFARPRSQRRTSSTACRGLGNSPNAALHRFRGPEANGARFWTPAACAASRKRPQRTVCEAQKPTAHVFDRLPRAWKFAKRGPAPISGPRSQRRTFLDACRLCREPQKAATDRLRGPEANGARLRPLAAGLEIRQTRPCTDFGAQKPTAHVFGRLPPVPRAAKGRNGPFARPRSQRRTSSTACRGLGNSPNAALHRFRGPEANGARFWTPAACAASRKRPQRTVCEAQKPTAHVFDRLPRAWKFAKRGPAPISGPRSQRRTFLDACRLCREPQKAATDRLRGPEANGARLRPLAAGLEIRQTRPCTDFGAQKPTAHVFGRLPPVPRAAKGRNGPFARPRSQRRTSSTACRGLGNSPNAALHRFRGPEANGARFWTPAACAASRKRPQRTVCEAQKPTAHVFDRLPRAWKFAKRGPAPISGPRSQRRTFLDACRLCREPQKAATDRLRGPEANGARLRPLAAGLEIRQTRPCTDFGAQKPTAHVFGRLPPVPRAAKGRNGPFARPRSQRRTSSTACRGLGNSPNAALHRFRGPEANGARFWTPAACAASRKRPQRTVCEAQKPTAHVFDRLPRAWKFAKRGPAPISGPRSQRRTFLDACRLCREPQKAATDRLRGPEANGARLRPLAAGLEIRQTRPCTDFGAQKPTAHVFGRLPPVPRAAKGRNGPFARPRSQRRTSSTACRGLGNSPNAALHRFRGPEANGARFWTPAACAASRKRPQRTVCEAQKPTAHVFDRLPRAWKFAKRGPAPISGPRSQRRTFLDACRLCREPQKAATDRLRGPEANGARLRPLAAGLEIRQTRPCTDFGAQKPTAHVFDACRLCREPQKAATDRLRGPEANGARLRPLAAGLEIRQTRPCTDFGAQKPTAHVFGRLPPVPRAAKGRNGPFARPRSQRRTSSTACRGLGNSPNAALHRFRGPEANGARFWTPAACAASRKRPQRTVCEAQKPTAHVFDRLPRAWKFAKRGPAPISGPRSQRRTFLDACRLCREPQKAATDRLRGPEANGARLRPLAAGLEIRQTRPCTDFGAQKPTAHVFGRLPPVPRAAKGRNGPFARPRSQRRTSSTACRGLGNSPNAALHRFRGPEANGARFWTPAACAASRKRPQRTVCEAQKPTAHVFDRLPRAWKFAKRGPAPISGPRSQRRTFLDACRLCREPQKAATDRLRGPEANGARLRPLAAGLEIRQTRPCTDFGAQKPTAHVFGRLPPVPRAAKGRNGPFARPRSQRRTSSTACRGLGNSPNAALHRFRGPEANGARFWTPAACAASRKRPQRTVCEAQKPTAHVFDRLPRAWKFAKRGPAPISGPRSQRRTFLDACRLCREPQKAATDRLRGPEANGARLRPLAAGLEIRQTRPCTDFGAQKPTAHVFGRLPPVPRAAKGRNGPFARPRSQRRTSSTACRGLGNSPNAALHRFRGPEANGARFWTPAACAASRKRPQRTVCEAQKPTAHVFDRLPRAWKFAKRGPAPISGPRSQRRTFLDACRLCREPQKAATDRLRGPEANGARLRPLAAGLEIRQTRPCTDFGAQKPTAHVFGRLPPVPRAAKGRNGPFARPRSQRRTSSTACRGLGNSPNAALHRFRGPEANGARFWTPAACAASRKRPQRTVCEAQKPTAHVFDRLPRAWKFAKRGPAPISGPRSQRRTFLDACRLCREPQKAATDRLRGPEANGARLRPLAAGLEIRQTRPCTDFGAQKPTAHVFGRLPPVPRAAKGRNGPFARPRSQRRTSSTACRGLGNSPNAALHRFRGPEANGARFWTPAACAASRKRPQRTVCEAQKPTAHVFDRLPRAWKFAKRGPAPISGPRSQRRTFLDACRLCREPQKAATDRLRGPEANGARLRPLAAGLEIRQTRPCTDFGAQKPTAHVFGRLPPVPRAAKGRNGPFARPRSQRRTSSTACRGLGNSPNAALHRFRGPEANGARFWTPAACAASRKRPQRTVCEAQKPTAHVFDRLPRAWKFAKRGPAPISGPRSQRRTFLDACRLCREPQKAATDRLRGPEANGARLRPLAAGLEIRQTRPCTDFGAQKPTAHVFGRLPPVPRAAKGRNGPFARPRSQRRTSSTACRGLGNSPNAALHRFRGPEANGARFWTPAACAASRKRPQRTVCEAQKPTAHVFDRLPRAWKFAKRGPAPISGPRSQRRTFLDACRLCREPQKAATDRLRGPEANGARLRPLAAGLEIRAARSVQPQPQPQPQTQGRRSLTPGVRVLRCRVPSRKTGTHSADYGNRTMTLAQQQRMRRRRRKTRRRKRLETRSEGEG